MQELSRQVMGEHNISDVWQQTGKVTGANKNQEPTKPVLQVYKYLAAHVPCERDTNTIIWEHTHRKSFWPLSTMKPPILIRSASL